MAYIFNGTNLNTFSFTAVKQSGSDIALSGHLDLPERIGKTFHSWDGQNNVEPYVAAGEIATGDRNIKLRGVISGSDRLDCINKLNAFYVYISSVTTVSPLVTPYGTFNVRIIEVIEGQRFSDTDIEVNLTFNEPTPTINGIIPSSDGPFGIDGISFEALGGLLVSAKSDGRLNRAATKQIEVKNYIGKTGEKELDLQLLITQPDYASLAVKIQGLHMLMIKPGVRTLAIKEDVARTFFAYKGFEVTNIRNNNNWYATVNIPITEL